MNNNQKLKFHYFSGEDAEQFVFYRIPKLLFKVKNN